MNLPDVPAEYYLCWSSIIIGVSVPLILAVLGVVRKDRRVFSVGWIAGSVFVFYIACWFWFLLAFEDPDYSMVPAYAWVILGAIVVLGSVLMMIGILLLIKKSAIGMKIAGWFFG